MGEPQSSYAADFTSNAKDTCDVCNVKASGVKYMRHKNPNKLGRNLCPKCYNRYLNKEGTVRRSIAPTAQMGTEHRQVIHKQIAAAQRGRVSNDVQAIGYTTPASLAGRAPSGYVVNPSIGPMHMPGPTVHLPGYPTHPALPTVHPQMAQAVGYTAEHAAYPVIRQDRIREAYSTYNAEVVVVEVRLTVKLPGKVREMLIHDCIEAVDHVPVHVGAVELKKQLYDAVIPKWREWTNNYPLSLEDVTMRNNNWVRLVPRYPDRDAISDQFFKRGKKGAVVFKAGKCIINLHVPNHIYSMVVARKEAGEPGIDEFEDEGKVAVISQVAADFTEAKTVTTRNKRLRAPSPSPSDSDIEITSTSLRLGHAFHPRPTKRSKVTVINETKKIQVESDALATPGRANAGHTGTSMIPSRTHLFQGSSSAERISQALKAQRCPTNKEISAFCKFSVTINHINHSGEILTAGEVDVSTFHVLVYPVEHFSLDDLVNKSTNPSSSTRQGLRHEKSFYLRWDNPLSATLRLDLSPSKVMKGGFKVAALGTSTTHLFKNNTADICAKRTYYPVERVIEQNGSFVTKTDVILYEGRKQFQNLSMEIACTVWAQALLDLVYKFISQEDCCPFNIPKFRFVELAIAMEGSPDGTKKQNLDNGTVFLVEEVIAEEREGPFRKYLNNVSPVPLTMTCKEDETRAKFLAFSQHVQYWKTKKLVFVSDYQGGNSLLTDPQISSAESLGRIFAEGNVPSIHKDFEKKHICNEFCKWFNIPTDYDSDAWH